MSKLFRNKKINIRGNPDRSFITIKSNVGVRFELQVETPSPALFFKLLITIQRFKTK